MSLLFSVLEGSHPYIGRSRVEHTHTYTRTVNTTEQLAHFQQSTCLKEPDSVVLKNRRATSNNEITFLVDTNEIEFI